MKKILVPINFSEVSTNALDYAIEMAKLTKAKLLLFHACYIPSEMNEGLVPFADAAEIENDYLRNLKQLRSKVHAEHGKELEIQCNCRQGFAVDEISSFAREQRVDLIVLGMHSAGFLTEKIIGSVTTSLLQRAACPVLAIDKEVKFKYPKRIVLATDYGETKPEVLQPLKTLVNLFHARLYVLNVVPDLETVPSAIEAANGVKLGHALEGLDHSFHDTTHEDVVEGINHFVNKHRMDMVVMIPRRHAVFHSIFKESTTKHAAYHLSIPLLALHEGPHHKTNFA